MISGHWSWEAQMAGAASSVAKPYACNAGLAGWEHGWSGGRTAGEMGWEVGVEGW